MGAARITSIVAMITAAAVGTTRWRGTEPTTTWRSRFKEAALQIPFGQESSPERDSLLPRDANVPAAFLKFKIATARSRDTSRAGGIAFRIRSDTAYPRLGIVQGVNYVWQDVANG